MSHNMEDYETSIMLATTHFINMYHRRSRKYQTLEPIENLFVRWVNIHYGLEIKINPDWKGDGSGVTVINVRDAELATMFKLRF